MGGGTHRPAEHADLLPHAALRRGRTHGHRLPLRSELIAGQWRILARRRRPCHRRCGGLDHRDRRACRLRLVDRFERGPRAMSSDLEVTRSHPVPDPGIPEHVERWTDVDPEASRRAERQVAACFGAVPLLALGFVAVYFFMPKTWAVQFAGLHAQAQNIWLGLLGGVAILLVGIGAVQWARLIMGDQ